MQALKEMDQINCVKIGAYMLNARKTDKISKCRFLFLDSRYFSVSLNIVLVSVFLNIAISMSVGLGLSTWLMAHGYRSTYSLIDPPLGLLYFTLGLLTCLGTCRPMFVGYVRGRP